MTTKFRKNLSNSGDGLLEKRATLIEQAALGSLRSKINSLEQDINLLHQQEAALCDLGPDTTQDLKPGKNFNSEGWVVALHTVRKDILLKEIDLDIYKKMLEEFFTEKEEG